MVKNLIDFFIIVGLLLPQFLSFEVGLLQLLQPEPHTTNIGFVSLLIGELGLEGTPETPELWQSVGSIDEDWCWSERPEKVVLRPEIDAFVSEDCKQSRIRVFSA